MRRQLFFVNFMRYLAILLLPIAILGLLIFIISVSYVEESVERRNEIVLSQGIESMDNVLAQMEAINLNISIRSSVARKVAQAFNHPMGGMPEDDYYLVSTVVDMLLAVAASNDFIYSIYLYVPNDYDLFIDSNLGIQQIQYHRDQGWYDSLVGREPSQKAWFERRDIFRYQFETEPTKLLSFYQKLSSPLLSEGVLVLNVYADEIGGIFDEVASATDMDFFLMSGQREILFANSDIKPYTEAELSGVLASWESEYGATLGGRPVVVSKKESSRWPEWVYVYVLDRQTLYSFPGMVGAMTVTLILICLFVGVLLAYRMTKRNVGYLERILQIIELSDANQPVEIADERSDVYGYILTNIVGTFATNQTLRTQLAEKSYHIANLEFMALRTQIRPHFLYNTLETINWMAIGLTNGPNVASAMIQHLSSILRYSFSHITASVTLREEIAVIEHYFEIQRARHTHFSDVIWSVDEELLDAHIMKFVIQPIVENSFQHGVGSGGRDLAIKLRVFRRGDTLRISITDSGAGMDKAALQALQKRIDEVDSPVKEHIGLPNTQRRIRLYYGEEYGLRIRSRPGWGTTVMLTLPILHDSGAAAPPKVEL